VYMEFMEAAGKPRANAKPNALNSRLDIDSSDESEGELDLYKREEDAEEVKGEVWKAMVGEKGSRRAMTGKKIEEANMDGAMVGKMFFRNCEMIERW